MEAIARIGRSGRSRQRRSRPGRPLGGNPVQTAHALTHALMDTALTHVRALALLYADMPPAMAPVTVARSVIEAGATAWWIMESGIGPRRRVARVTSERLRSAREAAKAIIHLDAPGDTGDYSETEEQVRNYADALGLAAAEGDPRIDGQVRPNSTDLISSLFETESAIDQSQARLVYPAVVPRHQGSWRPRSTMFTGIPGPWHNKIVVSLLEEEAVPHKLVMTRQVRDWLHALRSGIRSRAGSSRKPSTGCWTTVPLSAVRWRTGRRVPAAQPQGTAPGLQ